MEVCFLCRGRNAIHLIAIVVPRIQAKFNSRSVAALAAASRVRVRESVLD